MSESTELQLRSNPFRLFFPLGIVAGVLGVGHWVLWSVGWNIPQVALTHAALQSEGFLASFVVGFLMTAFPRFTGTWPATRTEIGAGIVIVISFLVETLRHDWIASQFLFLLLILNLIVFAARRVPHRNKPLPPSFLLMGFGFAHALTGAVLLFVSRFGTENFSLFSSGRQMIQLGFLLCIVLGVTGKLAPFLFGYTANPEHESPITHDIRDGKFAIAVHAFCGALIYGSFFVDNVSPRCGALIRAIVVTGHLLTFARISRRLNKRTTTMLFFYVSCWMIPFGLWGAALWPVFRIAFLHLVFIGGFSLMIFSFGLLIVLSHSSKAFLLNSPLTAMKIIGGLTVLAALFRLGSEIFATHYKALIHTASGFWVLAALTWAGYALPKTLVGKSEEPS